MPRPLLEFLATPSILFTLALAALWGAADLAYAFGLPGFPGGSVSHAVGRLYRTYPIAAEWGVIGFGIGLVFFLSWHFRTLIPGP